MSKPFEFGNQYIKYQSFRRLTVILGFLFIILFLLVIRWPTFSPRIWNVDEGECAVIAHIILDGGIPYRDAVCQRAPVTYYLWALTFWMFGKNNMVAIHGVLAVLLISVAILVYAIGGQVGASRRAAFLGTFLFVLTSSLGWSFKDTYAFHTEFCLILFSCLGAFLFLRTLLKSQSKFLFIIAGTCYGLAFFSKQPGLLDFLSVLVFLSYLGVSRITGITDFKIVSSFSLVKIGFFLSSGFAFVTICWFLFFYYNRAWSDFIFYFFTYPLEYYLEPIPLLHRILLIPAALGETISHGFLIGLLALIGLAFILFKLPSDIKDGNALGNSLQIFLVIWAVLSFLGSASTGRPFGHYFIQLMPSWSLLGGIAIDIMINEAFRAYPNSGQAQNSAGSLIIGVLVATLVMGTLAGAYFRFMTPMLSHLRTKSRSVTATSHEQGDRFSRFSPDTIIEYIQKNSDPNSKIFIWGWKPQYYVQANRLPASRYIYCTYIVGLIPFEEAYSKPIPGSLDILVSELRSSMPSLIIDTSTNNCGGEIFKDYPLTNFPKLWNFIHENYKLDRYVDNFAVYKLAKE